MSAITQKDIDFVLNAGEGLKIEFKENFSQLDRTMVAFANAEGGKVFLGINDRRKVVGIEPTNSLKSRIQDIARNCDPSIEIKLETFKNILIAEVPESKNKPHKCGDGFFMRIGPNSQKMSRDEIIDLIIKEGRVFFDDRLNHEFDIRKDLNKTALKNFLKMAKVKTSLTYTDILLNLGVAEKHGERIYLKNGGALFFAKNPQRHMRHANMTCVAYKDKEGVEAVDRKDLSGNYLDVVAEAEKFVQWNIRTGFKIKGFRREELPEYPIEAVREGFVNALMHRDYFEKGANVLLKIFPHEIVIDNPGGLVKGMSPKDLGRKSVSRNPLIADLFYRVGLAEKMGSGIKRMRNLMRKHGLKPPKIEVTEKFFTIIFRGPARKEIVVPAIEILNERQKKALKYIEEKGSISNKEYREMYGISPATAKRELLELARKRICKTLGAGRSLRYTLIR